MCNSINISVDIEWFAVPTDLTKCFVCEDVIFSEMWQVFIFLDNKLSEIKP